MSLAVFLTISYVFHFLVLPMQYCNFDFISFYLLLFCIILVFTGLTRDNRYHL